MQSESELVLHLTGFLQVNGYRVRLEVPNLGQSADVVATKGRWVTVIEAKLSNWKRGLSQCDAHSFVADFVCIAIASRSVPTSLENQASEKGIGIIHCESTGQCYWVCHPTLNHKVWRPERARFAMNLKEVPYVD